MFPGAFMLRSTASSALGDGPEIAGMMKHHCAGYQQYDRGGSNHGVCDSMKAVADQERAQNAQNSEPQADNRRLIAIH